uniref:NEDD4-binding protein 1-like n=1 Tax=Stegastes partitus TaxID=144197 RepID=A0A3B5A0U3_9TELE
MDGERSDVGGGGGGGDPEVEDEFACAGMLRGYLTSLHGSVERIFTVTFRIGADDLPHGDDGQIWLKLRGPSSNVKAAKLFVKGVVNQEEQQEVSYPGVLHCVFCGARGLFVDSLVKNTSAHIVVGSPGSLLISGLAEPVVRAYSLIADLVERYEGTQSRRPETGDRGSGESLDSRRAFKTLVETWEDRHILDLLVLPVSVKEILLDLVKEAGLGSNPKPMPTGVKTQERSQTVSKGRQDKQRTTKQTLHNPSTGDGGEGSTTGSSGGFQKEGSAEEKETSKSQTPHQVILPEVKGPPMPVYTSSLDLPLTNLQSNKQHAQPIYWPNQSPSKQNHHHNPKPQSALKQALQAPQPAAFANKDSSPTRARDRRGFTSSVVVTGEQRFLEGLQMPFELKLTDKPGDPKLRTIVIDGSNVAMSHGLGHFFSCRGIALAVQHFWDRGHRNISALLPQWRQKSDPKIKEQHYLTELQKVGVVSYTPSREVQGKRISSYDDRLILQLAQKTGGVIVTNDNLRDLSDESPAWRNIIKNRLLQYTFVGDHFMVPDDPLGRGGPHLDDFLRRLQGGSRITHERGWEPGHQHRQHVAAGAAVDRSPEETAALREQLCQVFPGQDNMVTLVLQCHPAETDINVLSDLILEQQKD